MSEQIRKVRKPVCDGCAHFRADRMNDKCAKGHGGLFRIQLGCQGTCPDRLPTSTETPTEVEQ